MSNKIVLGWFFGGRSTEHEVSVITALQAYENLDRDKYEVVPIYVSKDGKFYSDPKFLELKNYKDLDGLLSSSTKGLIGSSSNGYGLVSTGWFPRVKKIDVAFPMFHGSFGEDGCIQGLLEMYQIPYVGFNVTGSAISMDKIAQKAIYKELGLKVGKYVAIKRNEWLENPKKCLNVILGSRTPPESRKADSGRTEFARMTTEGGLKFPLFVKPATGGSSIGANKATTADALSFAVEVASTYSDKILIEEAFEDCAEVNCSVLGYGSDTRASVCEMPVASGDILSFADKYQRGGGKGSKGAGMASLSRIIPAPIPEKLAKQIQEATVKVFKALDGCGVARVDYFVDAKKENFWINEINTPPGSLAYYLWEKSGISYPELLDKLIEFAQKRFEDQKKTQYTFESGLLQQMATAKGTKN